MKTPSKLMEVVTELRKTRSSTDKLSILADFACEDVRAFLVNTYEPRRSYYLRPYAVPDEGQVAGEGQTEAIFAFVDALCARTITGNAARRAYADLKICLNKDGCEILDLILGRDIKAGVAAKQINKVWPGLITVPDYMRCVLKKNAKLTTWDWGRGVFSQQKEDGMFATLEVRDDQVAVISRVGTVFPGVDAFRGLHASAIAAGPALGAQCYDLHGEILVAHNGAIMPREKGNGVLNSILKTGEDPGEGYDVKYVAWDWVHRPAPRPISYRERFAALEAALAPLEGIRIVDTRVVTDMQAAVDHFLGIVADGGEGTIIKSPDMLWKPGDNPGQVKMKIEFEVELVVTGFNQGNGKNATTFGSLACQSQCGQLVVGVSGFTDTERQVIWDARDEWIGAVITVRANAVMHPTNAGAPASLFLPVFVDRRLDKSVANTYEEILEIYEDTIRP